MVKRDRDTGLDALLDLDGQILVVDEQGGCWVRFKARRVPVSEDRPHGLDYALTLHDASGERLVGFDNAHAAAGVKERDHRHRFKTVKPYEYKNAARLLEDFWAETERILRERGVIS
jgi:Family of unknown function (DUF6516)